jgi:plasmid stabilization system protein ParE
MPERVRVSFAAAAVADLEEILSYYADRQVPEVGSQLVVEILEKTEALGRHPDMGRVVPEFGRENLRELIHPPFRVVYRRDRGHARIVRVWRSERQITLPR